LSFTTRQLLITSKTVIINPMDSNRKITVNITNKTFLRAILWVFVTILIYKFIGRISGVLTLIFVAFFLALALNPIVSWVRTRLGIRSRAWATAVSYLLVVIFLTVFFLLVTPPLIRQTRDFIRQVPQTVENFQSQNSSAARFVRKYSLDKKLSQSAHDFASHYSNFGGTILDTGKRLIEVVVSSLAVIVMTFMMLVEGPKWLDLYFGTMPQIKRQHQRVLAYRMYKAVSGFVNGQIILAFLAGIFAFLALVIASSILDVHTNAAALAGIVAVFGIIPLFGNLIAATIVVIFSLLNSVSLALVMLVYFVFYFLLESHTLQPYLQSKLSELTPLMVFIAALIGVAFAGILGALVAIPAAAIIKILAEDYFERRQNREPAIKKA